MNLNGHRHKHIKSTQSTGRNDIARFIMCTTFIVRSYRKFNRLTSFACRNPILQCMANTHTNTTTEKNVQDNTNN